MNLRIGLYTPPGNWYLQLANAFVAFVLLVPVFSIEHLDIEDDVLNLHHYSCKMTEDKDNIDYSTIPDQGQKCSVHVSADVPTSLDVKPGDGWPGQSGQHIRSPLARTIYQKMREDELNRNNRHIYWYRVIVSRLNKDVQKLFLQLEQDEGTDDFLHNCQEKSDQIFTQIFFSIARPVLNIFMTQTSINGFLNRGSMFIFSQEHFEKLMGFSSYHKGGDLLDLGAGDGKVTLKMSRYFRNTYATEMSGMMVRRLTAHGFKVLDVYDWHSSNIQFDLIACLNLLDRCDKPMSLLRDIKKSLKPGSGRALVAVVIPFKPYVEFESKTHQPSEYLHVKGSNFEEEIDQFIKIFHNAGFEVERFTRLPYLCEGDLKHSFYVLTDALFVLRPKDAVSDSQFTTAPS